MKNIYQKHVKEIGHLVVFYIFTFLILGLLRFIWQDVGIKLILEYGFFSALFLGILFTFAMCSKQKQIVVLAFLLSGSYFIFLLESGLFLQQKLSGICYHTGSMCC